MNINTKEILKGIITINGNQVKTGMSISELERVLNTKIEHRNEHVGYVLNPALIEDEKPINLVTWFKGDTVEILKLNIGGFHDDDVACKYLDDWLEERRITEWIGGSYYQTEFGSLIPSLIHNGYNDYCYEIQISLEYGKIPSRKFPQIKENKNNSVRFVVDDSEFKIQRIPCREADMLPLDNWLENVPMSLDERSERYSKDDRKETIYFNITKIENRKETIIGIAEFTYFAVWRAYNNSELFITLDDLTEKWGILGFAIEKYGCGLKDKNEITPYILVFETIHDEIPHNKGLKVFMENEKNMKLLFESVMSLTSKYVKISEEDMTLISLSNNKDKMFSYYKTFDDIFINYQRSEKNATVK
ncbi:hypothetical protein [Bacillus cereus]|uniref:Uncharacterized protein n=1 Tax=Bacillus cereus TaxID=1396 RepID=A0A9X6Z7E4_BACCE|nr:hypothetical protein [Bacillus cereus]PFD16708.1 hypothetical protein CN263_26320 [Bacillus cereus]PFW60475.1 hypothetical protein COL27_31245 [Bacillus sp. AFS075960]